MFEETHSTAFTAFACRRKESITWSPFAALGKAASSGVSGWFITLFVFVFFVFAFVFFVFVPVFVFFVFVFAWFSVKSSGEHCGQDDEGGGDRGRARH